MSYFSTKVGTLGSYTQLFVISCLMMSLSVMNLMPFLGPGIAYLKLRQRFPEYGLKNISFGFKFCFY
jgi:hypothetical protein